MEVPGRILEDHRDIALQAASWVISAAAGQGDDQDGQAVAGAGRAAVWVAICSKKAVRYPGISLKPGND